MLLLSACGGNATTSATIAAAKSDSQPTANLQQTYVGVITRLSPEVVQISTPRGLGSGVVFDHHGDVVTNAHVIAGGGPTKVTDARGHTYTASVVGMFTPDDLAVVRAHGASLKPATFASSRNVKVGDIVLALGNPLGLRSSVTNGIISALGRTVSEPNGAVLPDVIQTSAAINPGNSGGALVNLAGDVVGIPTLAATDPQLGGGAAPGIGFAIPSSVVTDIAGQLISHGHVVHSHRAYLGVQLATGISNGAVVAAVQPGGPAARAGIAPGDKITAINGQATPNPTDVAMVLASTDPGKTAKLSIVKPAGTHATVNVKLGQVPGHS